MSGFLEIFLGIMSSLGGFVDIGELVFTVQAGARFGYMLLWAVVVGSGGIILFGEMSGRVAAALEKPTFEIIRDRIGFGGGCVILGFSLVVNLMTASAEIGGVAIALQLLTGLSYAPMVAVAVMAIVVFVLFSPFKLLERSFGLLGLGLLVFVAAGIAMKPDWGELAKGLVPRLPAERSDWALYSYYAVGILGSLLMPYEVYFYSSGGIEDKWTPKDIPMNRVTAGLGFSFGNIVAMSLIVVAAELFHPRGISPQVQSTSALAAAVPFGKAGLLVALVGMLFAVGGAAVETSLASGYSVCQFFRLNWGKNKPIKETRIFNGTWIAILVLGGLLMSTGVDPVSLIEYSVVFAVVTLPFTYLPLLQIAKSKEMGPYANGRTANTLGWLYLAIIVVVALASIPLMLFTHGGKG